MKLRSSSLDDKMSDFNLLYPIIDGSESNDNSKEEIQIDGTKRTLVSCNVFSKIHPSWHEFFFESGISFNDRLKAIYRKAYENNMMPRPNPRDVFNVFSMPLTSIKVVIVGQDPYPGWDSQSKSPVANGFSFATNSSEITGSLSRIFNSIQEKIGQIVTTRKENPYNLQGWIDQGVFLLNNTPVVYVPRDKKAVDDSESKEVKAYPKLVWKDLTREICKYIVSVNPNCHFILIGLETHYLKDKLPRCILTTHPSTRSSMEFTGDCFLQVDHIKWCQI